MISKGSRAKGNGQGAKGKGDVLKRMRITAQVKTLNALHRQ
jgi:hypothetical protein